MSVSPTRCFSSAFWLAAGNCTAGDACGDCDGDAEGDGDGDCPCTAPVTAPKIAHAILIDGKRSREVIISAINIPWVRESQDDRCGDCRARTLDGKQTEL